MDLTLSDEQSMLRESARRFVKDCTDAKARDAAELWHDFAELGWLALPIPDDHGGLSGSMLDVTVLLEELGRGSFTTPYVGTIVLGARLIATLGSIAQQASILPGIASGEHRIAFAHTEHGARGGPARLATAVSASGDTYRLTGTKIAVLDGGGADTLIVSALLEDRTVLMLVPRSAAGVSAASYPALGGGEAATLTFDDVALAGDALLGKGDATDAIEEAIDAAITASCAEAVGMMAALVEATIDYANTREQFGKPLTANQSVRFKLADMAVALEEARSMTLRAALTLAAPRADRIRAVAGAKAGVGRTAMLVAEAAIQLHGAMGVTEELTVGAYYKRILAFDAMFGGIEHQLVRHARASGRLTAERNAA